MAEALPAPRTALRLDDWAVWPNGVAVLCPRALPAELLALHQALAGRPAAIIVKVNAVTGISFDVLRGETLGLVGESGSGKSVSAMSILRLIPRPPGRIVEGEILFEGQNLGEMSDDELRHVRGNRIAMIFQEPMTSLNPVLTIGEQLTEAIKRIQVLEDKVSSITKSVSSNTTALGQFIRTFPELGNSIRYVADEVDSLQKKFHNQLQVQLDCIDMVNADKNNASPSPEHYSNAPAS